jgi:hypothetical protein
MDFDRVGAWVASVDDLLDGADFDGGVSKDAMRWQPEPASVPAEFPRLRLGFEPPPSTGADPVWVIDEVHLFERQEQHRAAWERAFAHALRILGGGRG